jgi:uncharacterized protein HemY
MSALTGKYLILAALLLLLAGILVYFFHDRLHWIGRLPGDIRIERDNFRFYFPLTTMVIFSVLLTVVVWIIRRLL